MNPHSVLILVANGESVVFGVLFVRLPSMPPVGKYPTVFGEGGPQG